MERMTRTTQRLIKGRTVTVDAQDSHLLDEWTWYISSNGYVIAAVPGNNKKRVQLHNLIQPPPDGLENDHKDLNRCNNTRDNLRLGTHSQNQANRRKYQGCLSQYKGVSRVRATGKWISVIKENGRMRYLGTFTDEQEAARAYDREAVRLYGDFARLNFPVTEPTLAQVDPPASLLSVLRQHPLASNGRRWETWALEVLAARERANEGNDGYTWS